MSREALERETSQLVGDTEPVRITAVITTYNEERFVRETLQGIASQTSPPDEILVLDDLSTDATPDIVEETISHWPKAHLVRSQTNRGVSVSRNTGIELASHRWIALCDGDDIWQPDHLETLKGMVGPYPEVGMAFTLVQAFGERTHQWEQVLPEGEPVDGFWESLAAGIYQPSSVLLRKDAVESVGGFRPGLNFVEDFDLGLRLARRYKVICSSRPTVHYRKRPGGVSMRVKECRKAEYLVRERFFRGEVEASSDQEFLTRLRQANLDAFSMRYVEAWTQRDAGMMDFLDTLSPRVEGGEAIVSHWKRRRKMIPLARLKDFLLRRGSQ